MENREKDLNIGILADIYGKLITGRQLEIIRDYYDSDYSLAEIAEKYGIARQSVKDSLKAAKESLLGYEESLKLKERFSLINKYAEMLSDGNLREGQREALIKDIKSLTLNFTE